MSDLFFLFFFQVPDNAVMALVPKQVTAYNSVNNSTVSRTSASKYGKPASLQWILCQSLFLGHSWKICVSCSSFIHNIVLFLRIFYSFEPSHMNND